MQKIFSVVAVAVAAVAIPVALAIGILEWLAGCGDTWVDAAGNRHLYECVILTFLN